MAWTKKQLRESLNLPETSFPMRANLLSMEPAFQARWREMDAHARMRRRPHPAGPFVFHDGPPYANGSIHMGHLVNKVLKDFVVRSRGLVGHDVHYVPGWDCHGLPIEHQVMKALGDRARTMSRPDIRQACRAHAEGFVDQQRAQMERLGTLADYASPYLTMDPQYEADALAVFADLIERGLVYQDKKPVHWSIANQTALADAELEYFDREDLSVYVLFELTGPLPDGEEGAWLMIWTTTPWTLPANLAVCLSPQDTYGLYDLPHRGGSRRVLLATELADKVLTQAGVEPRAPRATYPGRALAEASLRYRHPFIAREGVLLAGGHVTVEDGTGLVHTAPGHGEDDHRIGLEHGLDVYCPVLADGTYDDSVPEWLQGVDVWSANDRVADHLRESGHLFFDHRFVHSYPHDWRSKTPTIFRATEQW